MSRAAHALAETLRRGQERWLQHVLKADDCHVDVSHHPLSLNPTRPGTTWPTRATCTASPAAPMAATSACCCATWRCVLLAQRVRAAGLPVLCDIASWRPATFCQAGTDSLCTPSAGGHAAAGAHLPAHVRAHLGQPAEEGGHGHQGWVTLLQKSWLSWRWPAFGLSNQQQTVC